MAVQPQAMTGWAGMRFILNCTETGFQLETTLGNLKSAPRLNV